MRLGAPIFGKYKDPQSWVNLVKKKGYRAAYCPVSVDVDETTTKAYAIAAEKADIVIAEAGVWNNPLHPDKKIRNDAIELCKKTLDLAERINARCCVNISGSRGVQWDGPDPANLTEETFDKIVEIVREIIDAVKPARTFYTLETMPYMYPDSIESYLRLIKTIDRKAFAVHLDPVNIISSPQIYFNNTTFLKECFAKLGSYIKAIHAKDLIIHNDLPVYIQEVRPGLGTLDYATFLSEANKLDKDMPFMLEHLTKEKEYDQAAEYVRSVAESENLIL